MRVTVSIATMGSRELLSACLSTLPAACAGIEWTAVVVDNRSRDGTADLVRGRFPGVQLVENVEERGFGANHNQVLRGVVEDADPDHLALILNDDTELQPGSITALAAALRDEPRAGAVTPSVRGPDGRRQPVAWGHTSQRSALARAVLGRSIGREAPEDAEWLSGCCLLVPSCVLRDVGLFDERFHMYAEDVDLCLRIRARGLRLWECGDASILHHGAVTTGRPSHAGPLRLQAERSHHLLLRKHRGPAVAAGVSGLHRGIHALRGGAQYGLGAALRDERRRRSGAARLAIARYDPRQPVFPEQERCR